MYEIPNRLWKRQGAGPAWTWQGGWQEVVLHFHQVSLAIHLQYTKCNVQITLPDIGQERR